MWWRYDLHSQRFWRSLVHDSHRSSWQSSFGEDPVIIVYYEMEEHRRDCEVAETRAWLGASCSLPVDHLRLPEVVEGFNSGRTHVGEIIDEEQFHEA